MNSLRRSIRLAWLVLLLISVSNMAATGNAQQSSPAPNAEQEFLDAIKKGNAARVGEMLKQDPALIKASTKTWYDTGLARGICSASGDR